MCNTGFSPMEWTIPEVSPLFLFLPPKVKTPYPASPGGHGNHGISHNRVSEQPGQRDKRHLTPHVTDKKSIYIIEKHETNADLCLLRNIRQESDNCQIVYLTCDRICFSCPTDWEAGKKPVNQH
jgi:hypothetical protein